MLLSRMILEDSFSDMRRVCLKERKRDRAERVLLPLKGAALQFSKGEGSWSSQYKEIVYDRILL